MLQKFVEFTGDEEAAKKKVLDLGFYSKQGHSFSLPMASNITRKGDWIHELKCVEWLMHVPGTCD